MSPIDKTPEAEKEAAEKEDDLRYDWLEADIEAEGRKPDLQEIEEDSSVL